MKTLNDALLAFRKEKEKTRIAIFRHEKSTNEKLYSSLCGAFSKYNFVEMVDSFFLSSYEALHGNYIDILVVPEVENLIPVDCYKIDNYLRWGGALIIGGDDMLMLRKTPEDVVRLNGLANIFGREDDPLAFFRGTVGVLGIKPYTADVDPVGFAFDTDFIRTAPKGIVNGGLYRSGVKCNTTSKMRVPFPFVGCAFAERYEVLRNYDIVSGFDGLGRKINSAVCFSENWETGARVCVFPSNEDNSFFSEKNLYHSAVLNGAVDFCKNKLLISYCMPGYACYRQGENPRIDYKVKSFNKNNDEFDVDIQIIAGGETVHSERKTHKTKAMEETFGTIIWNTEKFEYDYYEIAIKIIKDGKIVSKTSNAFVIWDENVIRNGRELILDNEYFNIDNRRTVVLGTNYYESNTNSHMWVMPNISKLNADLKQMAEFGINYIRIHYHHPKWFYDFWKQCYDSVPDIYKDLGESYLPSEKYLRIFDAHIYLCQKYRIIYGGDLFTLVPEEMGDPRGWYGTVDYCVLNEKIKAQKEFLEILIPRYKDVSGINWDIINEPYIGEDRDLQARFHKDLSAWEVKIKELMIQLGEKHPITVGNDFSGLYETGIYSGVADYLAPHGNYKRASQLRWDSYKGPQFYHEVHMDSPFTPDGEKKQLGFMQASLIDCFRTGLAGFAPWQWTGQLAMWQSTGTHPGENWDDMLGCCVRHDGTINPPGRFYRDFIRLFGDITISGYSGLNKVIASDGEIHFKPVAEAKSGECYFCYLRDNNPVRGIAKSFFKGNNFSIKTNSEPASVFFDFSDPKFALIKADEACKLDIELTKEAREVLLTDGSNQSIVQKTAGKKIEIEIAPWQTYCWYKIIFQG